MSRCTSTPGSGRNRIIPLMRRSNSDSVPSKPVMLQKNQLLIHYMVTSPVHSVTIRCYGTRWSYKCGPTLRVVEVLISNIVPLPCLSKFKCNIYSFHYPVIYHTVYKIMFIVSSSHERLVTTCSFSLILHVEVLIVFSAIVCNLL
jgi:hypothetical protein